MRLFMIENIDEVWDYVRERVERIQAAFGLSCTTDDVKEVIEDGLATLWMSEDRDGFVILKINTNLRTKEDVLWIWLAYGRGFAQQKYLSDLEEIASRLGAKSIEMASSRSPAAFVRTGWKVKEVTYTRKVT